MTTKTVQITLDDTLLAAVDQTVAKLNTTRSAFVRRAVELALHQEQVRRLEMQHAEGYGQRPVEPGEFDLWTHEQVWEST